MLNTDTVAKRLFGASADTLDARALKVAQHIARRKHISRNVDQELDQTPPTFGQRAADAVATFGGSWAFVLLFCATMVAWVGLNSLLLWARGSTFDPYPYIMLNLFLSMLAAIQAPIILMSQNRQADKDRIRGEHDYEVNLKAELEIMLLHEKIDELQKTQWSELITIQSEQLQLLRRLADGHRPI